MYRLVKRNLLATLLLGLLFGFLLPATASAQGRRNGRVRNFDNWKCDRFVNCHDARDGRWDGRGPRRGNSSWWDWRQDRWRDRRGRRSVNTWWNANSRDYRWRNRDDNDWRYYERRRMNRWRDDTRSRDRTRNYRWRG